jgi:murein DD-endopeptidase MepM/ murein hydrolase activator NlpD
LTHKKHRKKFLNILLIPDDESSPKSFKIRYSILLLILFFLLFLVILFITATFTYGKLLQQAYENISLREENEQLSEQLTKMNELTAELDNLKNYGRKVQSSLMGYVNLTSELDDVSELPPQINASNQSVLSTFNSIPIRTPVSGFVSQEFKENLHNGVDIVAPEGTPILAAASGNVLFSGWTIDGGNTVVIGHYGGYYSYYKHNLRNIVFENQDVKQGEIIGYLGNSGQKSYGPHLHFEIWKDGVPIDPKILVSDY